MTHALKCRSTSGNKWRRCAIYICMYISRCAIYVYIYISADRVARVPPRHLHLESRMRIYTSARAQEYRSMVLREDIRACDQANVCWRMRQHTLTYASAYVSRHCGRISGRPDPIKRMSSDPRHWSSDARTQAHTFNPPLR